MNLLKQFFRLARPFWAGKSQWREWLLLASVIGFTLFSIFMSVKIAAWDKRFYDALAAFNGKAMPALVVEYCGYMGLIIACIVCGDWLQKRLIFRWRTHLTERFQSNWLGNHKHYRLQLTGELPHARPPRPAHCRRHLPACRQKHRAVSFVYQQHRQIQRVCCRAVGLVGHAAFHAVWTRVYR